VKVLQLMCVTIKPYYASLLAGMKIFLIFRNSGCSSTWRHSLELRGFILVFITVLSSFLWLIFLPIVSLFWLTSPVYFAGLITKWVMPCYNWYVYASWGIKHLGSLLHHVTCLGTASVHQSLLIYFFLVLGLISALYYYYYYYYY
jgi:hypothetical protein